MKTESEKETQVHRDRGWVTLWPMLVYQTTETLNYGCVATERILLSRSAVKVYARRKCCSFCFVLFCVAGKFVLMRILEKMGRTFKMCYKN